MMMVLRRRLDGFSVTKMTDYHKKYSDTAAAVDRIKQLEQHETELAVLIRDLRNENDALKTENYKMERRIEINDPILEKLKIETLRLRGRIGGLTTQIRKLNGNV